MIYFHETKRDIKYHNIIEAIDDRVDIAMQKSPYLYAYKVFAKFVFMIWKLKKFAETHCVFSWNLGLN